MRWKASCIVWVDDDPDADAVWVAEADRREAELERGSVKPISLEDTLAKLRERLAKTPIKPTY